MSVEYSFVPLTRADYPMIRGWLSLDHVRAWWGDPDRELALLEEEMDRDVCDMRVVHADAPFAFVQDYPVHAFGGPQYHDLPETARAMDMFLGDPAYLGQGHAAAFLRTRAFQVLAEGAPAVVVDPDPANTRAIAAYKRAGFVSCATVPCEDGDPVLVMKMTPDRARSAA